MIRVEKNDLTHALIEKDGDLRIVKETKTYVDLEYSAGKGKLRTTAGKVRGYTVLKEIADK